MQSKCASSSITSDPMNRVTTSADIRPDESGPRQAAVVREQKAPLPPSDAPMSSPVISGRRRAAVSAGGEEDVAPGQRIRVRKSLRVGPHPSAKCVPIACLSAQISKWQHAPYRFLENAVHAHSPRETQVTLWKRVMPTKKNWAGCRTMDCHLRLHRPQADNALCRGTRTGARTRLYSPDCHQP